MRKLSAAEVERASMATSDQAFDATIERPCDLPGCGRPGRWRPVLLLRPSRDYMGKSMRFPLGIVVCGQHRLPRVDQYLVDDMWETIVGGFAARGKAPPHRGSTRLEFDLQGPLPEDDGP